ncbi:hypothetical protein P3X46_021969 [Hevea brasiliensis]|uniref:SPX domain-containing protein n=1 Tax=Hevea brasiliensis TaxID=3981 RepID=A0ABQ9LK30_HEVBR|nr:uncharacterized protein LOC110665078 [Hevea brasiliensis]KAJ9167305.1 hypothetical protein P3X46_021969 [Hevea brasiliensis]
MGVNNLVEEKALLGYGDRRSMEDSLEERVSLFLDEVFDDSDPSFDAHDYDDDDDSFIDHHNAHLHDSMERTIFWESQEALLQEVLERYSLTVSKLRQEINKIIEMAKERDSCKCLEPITCFRQKVVDLLCQRGFSASLCTSQWKHTKKFPGGKHEYIEVIVSTSEKKKQIPYLIELEFKEQFEIAKACEEYKKLIAQLPKYYIGKADYLNAIVGILCDSAKRSMKEKKIHMGPWRKRSFVQMKWSSSSTKGGESIDDSSSNKFSPLSSRQAHESCFHFSVTPAVIVT